MPLQLRADFRASTADSPQSAHGSRVGRGQRRALVPTPCDTPGVFRPAAMPASRLKEPTMFSEPLTARLLLMFDLVVLMVLNPATSSAPTASATASCLSSATR